MLEIGFFRIFELLIIVALLYLAWRFLKADVGLIKKKVDAILTQEEGEKDASTTKK